MLKIFARLTCGLLLLGSTVAGHAASYQDAVDSAIAGDYARAFSYWMPLAKNGDGRAQFNIALMYHGGIHVTGNEKTALFWYHKAAENGVREAQEYLAVGYREGWFGLQRNINKARYWEARLQNDR